MTLSGLRSEVTVDALAQQLEELKAAAQTFQERLNIGVDKFMAEQAKLQVGRRGGEEDAWSLMGQ